MPQQLTLEDARQSLTAHVAGKGAELRAKYGSPIGWTQLQRILLDGDFVRYPCELVFDSSPLEPGETAFPQPRGERPEDGYRLCVHPYFALDAQRVPLLALYQLVAINYGGFASAEDAEAFGAAALGLTVDDYYTALCALADEISTEGSVAEEPIAGACHCGGTGVGCGSSPPRLRTRTSTLLCPGERHWTVGGGRGVFGPTGQNRSAPGAAGNACPVGSSRTGGTERAGGTAEPRGV